MKTIRLTALILAGIMLLVGIPYFGIYLYRQFSRPDSEPLDAVPDKAAFIIRINRPADLYAELNRSNLIWQEISSYPGVSDLVGELKGIDSLTATDSDVRRLVEDNPIYITLALTGRNEFGLIYSASAGRSFSTKTISSFLRQHYPGKTVLVTTPYASTELLRFQHEKMEKPMFVTVCKGVFIMSNHSDLVKKAIDRLSLNYIPASSTGFRTLNASSGRKSDANIFLNIPYLSLSVWKHASDESKRDLIRMAKFADWCGLDVIIRKDELLMNGYTLSTDSNYYTVSLHSPQTPQSTDAIGILPDNVVSFILYSMENFSWYLDDLTRREQRLESPAEPSRLSQYNAAQGIRTERFFLPWTGNQFCFATVDENIPGNPSYPIALIRHTDPDSSLKYLRDLSEKIGRKTDSVKFNEYTIYLTDLSEPLSALFGSFQPSISFNCFMLFNGFTVFARSPLHLAQMVNHFSSGTTLSAERSYTDINDDLSAVANISFFCKPGHALATPSSFLNDALSAWAGPLKDSLRKFESLTFQVVNRKGQFYTSISLRFNPDLSNEGPLSWRCLLDTTVSGTPGIVSITPRGGKGLLVTDTLNTLYLIDSTGTIMWKKRLYGRVLGGFHSITLKEDGSLYFLFNTENHLYLIRQDGELADRFPMKFPIRATNGLTLADYNQNGDYRILVAFRDNRLYSFTLDGMMAPGWELPSLPQEVSAPVQYLIYDHKDHLLFRDTSGHFLITDRRGNVRIRPAKPFPLAPRSVFGINQTAKKGAFLTTDLRGRIVLLAENGKISFLTCGTFSPDHTFRYEDINGNHIPDFIFFDRNVLSIYNRSMKLVYSYRFLHETAPPHLFRKINGRNLLGVYSRSSKEVFLFDSKGLVRLDPNIKGSTPFDIGNLETGTIINLVIGSGRTVKCFRLTQF